MICPRDRCRMTVPSYIFFVETAAAERVAGLMPIYIHTRNENLHTALLYNTNAGMYIFFMVFYGHVYRICRGT